MTLRLILSDLKTSIEALAPTTDSSNTFKFITNLPAVEIDNMTDGIRHREILLVINDYQPQDDFGAQIVASNLAIELHVVHYWRDIDAFESETVRVEDSALITEAMLFDRPGSANGIRFWEKDDESIVRTGQHVTTILEFTGHTRLLALA